MNFDFPTILVLATLITGLIWLMDALLWAPRRRTQEEQLLAATGGNVSVEQIEEVRKQPLIVEYARSFFPVILAVLVLRSFIVEPFRIPSNSMMPTLLTGDFILVNKFSYGLRLPVLNNKIWELGDPERGDVVVFRFPGDPKIDYIKRVIGVPGDEIVYADKTLYINGQRMDQDLLGEYTGVGAGSNMTGSSLRREDLGTVEHRILVRPEPAAGAARFIVPHGQYFAMGDNRDNSNDSRYWGPVPEANLVGKAFMIWMNWDSSNGGVAWDRLGSGIE